MASLDLQFDKAQFLETAERMQFCYEELLENGQQQEIMFLSARKKMECLDVPLEVRIHG